MTAHAQYIPMQMTATRYQLYRMTTLDKLYTYMIVHNYVHIQIVYTM